MKGRLRRGKVLDGWEEERKEFYEESGWTLEQMEGVREGGGLRGEELMSRERKLQEEESWRRIGKSKSNRG